MIATAKLSPARITHWAVLVASEVFGEKIRNNTCSSSQRKRQTQLKQMYLRPQPEPGHLRETRCVV